MRWSSPHGGQLITVGAEAMRTGHRSQGTRKSALELRTTDYGRQFAEPSASPALHSLKWARTTANLQAPKRRGVFGVFGAPRRPTLTLIARVSLSIRVAPHVERSWECRNWSLAPSCWR
jgi:hypothetical protein